MERIAQSLQLVHNLDKINGVPKGNTMELDVSYTYSGSKAVQVFWKFNGTLIVSKVGTIVQSSKLGATIRGNATLILTNTTLSDNGTYTIEVAFLGEPAIIDMATFEVIIQVPPKAKASCSGKGDNVSCLCEGIGGNPPAHATWLKGTTEIKGPKYLSATLDKTDIISNKEGVYTCKANSANLIHEENVTLSKPKVISFRSKNVGGKIKLVCTVVGTIIPAPVYLISFCGSEVKEYGNGVKDIGTVNSGNNGRYECLVKNVLGEVRKHLFLNETEKTVFDKSGNGGTDWYLFLITSLCGVIVGMMLMYAIMWLRLRLSQKRNHSVPSVEGKPSGEDLENTSAYQELNLQKMNKGEGNYQSLRMTSSNARSNTAPVETEIEDEAAYVEPFEFEEE